MSEQACIHTRLPDQCLYDKDQAKRELKRSLLEQETAPYDEKLANKIARLRELAAVGCAGLAIILPRNKLPKCKALLANTDGTCHQRDCPEFSPHMNMMIVYRYNQPKVIK